MSATTARTPQPAQLHLDLIAHALERARLTGYSTYVHDQLDDAATPARAFAAWRAAARAADAGISIKTFGQRTTARSPIPEVSDLYIEVWPHHETGWEPYNPRHHA